MVICLPQQDWFDASCRGFDSHFCLLPHYTYGYFFHAVAIAGALKSAYELRKESWVAEDMGW